MKISDTDIRLHMLTTDDPDTREICTAALGGCATAREFACDIIERHNAPETAERAAQRARVNTLDPRDRI